MKKSASFVFVLLVSTLTFLPLINLVTVRAEDLTVHQDGFEGTPFDSNFSSKIGNWSAVNSPVYSGLQAASVTTPNSVISNSTMHYNFTNGYVNATLTVWINFKQLPEVVGNQTHSNDFDLMIAGFDTNKMNCYIAWGLNPWTYYQIPCGYYAWDNGNGNSVPAFVPVKETWHNVTIRAWVGNNTAFDEWTRTYDWTEYWIWIDGEQIMHEYNHWEISGYGGVLPEGYVGCQLQSAWVGPRYIYGASDPVNSTIIYDDYLLVGLPPTPTPSPSPSASPSPSPSPSASPTHHGGGGGDTVLPSLEPSPTQTPTQPNTSGQPFVLPQGLNSGLLFIIIIVVAVIVGIAMSRKHKRRR